MNRNGRLAIVDAGKRAPIEATFLMLKDGGVYFEGSVSELEASPDPYLQKYLAEWIPPLVT